MTVTDIGHPTDEPCAVCGGRKNNQVEPRFVYSICEDHRRVPPASLDTARGQLKHFGKTYWDQGEPGHGT